MVQLQWTKLSGGPNSFIVERSADGKLFSDIGTVQAMATGRQYYGFADPSPLPGLSYYRLKMVDQQLVATLSSTISIAGCNPDKLQLITDPATGQSALFLQLTKKSTVNIGLCDVLGRRLDMPGLSGQFALSQGQYQLPVPAHALAAGVYFLSVTINGENTILRMLQH